MNIQFFQLVVLAAYALAIYGAYKTKIKFVRYLLIGAVLIAFFVNPFRFTQQNTSALERPINRFNDIPAKVVVDTPPFTERQNIEMNKFNEEYKESRDEIHN